MGFGESVLLFTCRQQVLLRLPLPAPVILAAAASEQELAGLGLVPGVSLLCMVAEVSVEMLWRLVLKQHLLLPCSHGGSGTSSQQRFATCHVAQSDLQDSVSTSAVIGQSAPVP